MSEKFKIGDTVTLKEGSEKMEVSRVFITCVRVKFKSGEQTIEKSFKPSELRLFSNE